MPPKVFVVGIALQMPLKSLLLILSLKTPAVPKQPVLNAKLRKSGILARLVRLGWLVRAERFLIPDECAELVEG
jgi:hypothetical protein